MYEIQILMRKTTPWQQEEADLETTVIVERKKTSTPTIWPPSTHTLAGSHPDSTFLEAEGVDSKIENSDLSSRYRVLCFWSVRAFSHFTRFAEATGLARRFFRSPLLPVLGKGSDFEGVREAPKL